MIILPTIKEFHIYNKINEQVKDFFGGDINTLYYCFFTANFNLSYFISNVHEVVLEHVLNELIVELPVDEDNYSYYENFFYSLEFEDYITKFYTDYCNLMFNVYNFQDLTDYSLWAVDAERIILMEE